MDGKGKGLKAITECNAEEGARICLTKLKGKDRKAVVDFLGEPHRTHEQEEYLYYPERSDGSTWLLLVSFDEKNRVCSIGSDELGPYQETQPKD
jgi:hypothetical protein